MKLYYMKQRNPEVYLLDIAESIEAIERHIDQVDKDEFMINQTVQDAVVRRLEVIGEATKHLPSSLTELRSEIPWKEIAGMRDVLIHEYFGVNIGRVWKVVENDLSDLKEAVHYLIDHQDQ